MDYISGWEMLAALGMGGCVLLLLLIALIGIGLCVSPEGWPDESWKRR